MAAVKFNYISIYCPPLDATVDIFHSDIIYREIFLISSYEVRGKYEL